MVSTSLAHLSVLQSYGAQGFKVNDVFYAHSILLAPQYCAAWPVATWADVTQDVLAAAIELLPKPDILLIGTGAIQHFLAPALKQWISAQGIVVETMNTGAACRTYSVLVAEDRKVAAALIF